MPAADTFCSAARPSGDHSRPYLKTPSISKAIATRVLRPRFIVRCGVAKRWRARNVPNAVKTEAQRKRARELAIDELRLLCLWG
eukprot:1384073-Prymnesium_polylepis.1